MLQLQQLQRSLSSLLLLLCIAPLSPVWAWGSLGHRTVAYLSTLYSANKTNSQEGNANTTTARMINSLLLGQDISEAALFADKVAHVPSFAYSRPWHYIDAADSPPLSCGIDLGRDCRDGPGDEGCIISAIRNETSRVLDPTLPRFLRAQSLRFVLHFIGDVHQPLHTEALARGGNEIAVRFDSANGKTNTNLHSVWDTLVVHKWRRREEWFDRNHPRESEEEAAYLWALELFNSTFSSNTSGGDDDDIGNECVFSSSISSSSSSSSSNAQGRRRSSSSSSSDRESEMVECVLQWAQQANQLVCEYVLKDGIEAVQAVDLGQAPYYDGAREIVDAQIRRAGRRLAGWLDRIAEEWEEQRQPPLPLPLPLPLVVQG